MIFMATGKLRAFLIIALTIVSVASLDRSETFKQWRAIRPTGQNRAPDEVQPSPEPTKAKSVSGQSSGPYKGPRAANPAGDVAGAVISGPGAELDLKLQRAPPVNDPANTVAPDNGSTARYDKSGGNSPEALLKSISNDLRSDLYLLLDRSRRRTNTNDQAIREIITRTRENIDALLDVARELSSEATRRARPLPYRSFEENTVSPSLKEASTADPPRAVPEPKDPKPKLPNREHSIDTAGFAIDWNLCTAVLTLAVALMIGCIGDHWFKQIGELFRKTAPPSVGEEAGTEGSARGKEAANAGRFQDPDMPA